MVTATSSIFRDAAPRSLVRPRSSTPPAIAVGPTIAIRPPTAAVPDTADGKLIAILDAPLASGESALAGFQRKEHELGTLIATLSATACHALHERLATPQHGDELAHKFARLTVERRTRLLDFLADARRRENLAASHR